MTSSDRISAEIIAAAEEAYGAFETRTRAPEAGGEEYTVLKDGCPGTGDEGWIKAAIFAAHDTGGMLPDDWRYQFIRDAFGAISDAAEDADSSEVCDEYAEPDIYTNELTGWLASHNDRYSYCDDAAEEWGAQTETLKLIGLGQMAEKTEVFWSVLSSIAEHVGTEVER